MSQLGKSSKKDQGKVGKKKKILKKVIKAKKGE